MFSLVLLVSSLSSSFSSSKSSSSSSSFSNKNALVYAETPTDTTTAAKLIGALENAAVFIIIIVVVTFLIFILYYYRFTNFLKNYMRFYAFVLLSALGGAIFVFIIKHFSVAVDALIVGLTGGRGVPIVVTQGYTVVLRIIGAAWLTQLLEWTTWVLLLALSVDDVVMVLAPSRNDYLPGVMYQARPIKVRAKVSRDDRGGGEGGVGALGMVGVSQNVGVEMQNLNRNDDNSENVVDVERESERSGEERVSPVEDVAMRLGIQLGLGDFTFYSVLIGRAAIGSAFANALDCYLAMLSGLACNLIILLAWRKPLPALPIPIAFGIMFYFLTRFLMEPFVVQTSTNLLMFCLNL
ncbi:hypothetical protein RND81_06G111800 [Saponaria officinalis]|uniref:Presenilin n=1 Tax=Saponaria officinalis TaxID=3572 RepID=A0AAW1K8L5_SAPOF